MEISVLETPSKLVESAAERFAALVRGYKGVRELRVLITGGTLGIDFLRALGALSLDLRNVRFIFGDERFVDLSHADRNEAQGLAVWPALERHVTRYPNNDRDLGGARDSFNAQMTTLLGDLRSQEAAFDLVILGMGPDGHVASLFPGREHDAQWIVAEKSSPKPPAERLSFSYEALKRGKEVWFLVSGAVKADAVRCALGQDCNLPAGKVKGLQSTVWFIDQELKLAL